MIELSGLEPDRDVAIEFTGALPGEKLHEELWSTDETIHATKHPKILRSTRPPIDAGWLEEELAELQRLVADGETLELVSRLGAMVKEPRRVSAAVVQESAQTRHE
jgi:FlaA1/EpsC-like NDP-sugar epimerase